MELTLTDAFYRIVNDILYVDEEIILNTYKNPTLTQQLENSITLFLKEFGNNRLSNLLLASQKVNDENLFAFAYWIPQELVSTDIPLLDTLEVFAHNFGCKIRVSTSEGYFIRNARKLIQGKLESPNQLMEILGSVHIPCESYVFYNEKNEFNLNWVECYYCFAINNNKYLTWLEDIEIIEISVKREWFTYLSEIRDVLNPYGNTGLKILNKKSEEGEGLTSYKEELENKQSELCLVIPKSYQTPFTRINQLLTNLGKNEKIIVIPQHEHDRCIFCGATNISQEHIFAQWMRAYFPEKKFKSTLHVRTPEDSLLDTLKSGVSKGTESSYGYTTHKICVQCNGTWMSQLEEKAKGILVSDTNVFKEKINELGLDAINSKQLALWIIVKSILFTVKAMITPKLPDNALCGLKSGVIPHGFLVEIAECETADLNFIVNKGAFAMVNLLRVEKMDKEIAKKLANDFFKVSIQMHHFLFRVSYLDESQGLKREAWIKPTTILYPANHQLQYKRIDNEQKMWDKVQDNLKLHVFNIGLSLIDR